LEKTTPLHCTALHWLRFSLCLSTYLWRDTVDADVLLDQQCALRLIGGGGGRGGRALPGRGGAGRGGAPHLGELLVLLPEGVRHCGAWWRLVSPSPRGLRAGLSGEIICESLPGPVAWPPATKQSQPAKLSYGLIFVRWFCVQVSKSVRTSANCTVGRTARRRRRRRTGSHLAIRGTGGRLCGRRVTAEWLRHAGAAASAWRRLASADWAEAGHVSGGHHWPPLPPPANRPGQGLSRCKYDQLCRPTQQTHILPGGELHSAPSGAVGRTPAATT
jgi:hypothetical protein